MPNFPFETLFAQGSLQLPHVWELLARMGLAALLGTTVAFRVWRKLLANAPAPTLQGAQSQALIAAAGAVMVVVIGDQPARAFGLVGIGSFIRFRSGISDPRDAAIMFLMIGIGMACGLGLFVMAIAATVLICILLLAFDWAGARMTKRTTISVNAVDPHAACASICALWPGTRVIELAANAPELGKDSGKLLLEVGLPGELDAAKISRMFEERGVPGIRRVALARDDS